MDVQDELPELTLGVDLLQYVPTHLDFLAKVNQYPALYSGPVLRLAVSRYEQLWLPLAAEHRSEFLTAPLDIEWVWHCHMLAPEAYQRDCFKTVKCLINHRICDQINGVDEKTYELTRAYWKEKYPNEPFEVDILGPDTAPKDPRQDDKSAFSGSKLEYDIEAASLRQRSFYYQVSLKHYRDEAYLKKSLKRYQKFLLLRQKYPDIFLVPCYDMDLIWHTHQLFPYNYQQDTIRLLGKILNHDDTVNDRSQGSKLNMSHVGTRRLWLKTFGDQFSACGAMFRGDPPQGKFYTMSREEIFQTSSKKTKINIEQIEVLGVRRCKFHLFEETKKSVHIQGQRRMSHAVESDILKIKLPTSIDTNATCGSRSFERYFPSKEHKKLYVKLTKISSSLLCTSGMKDIGQTKVNLQTIASKLTRLNGSVREKVELDLGQHANVTMEMTLTPIKLTDCVLWLDVGKYETSLMPEQVENLWGPVSTARVPPEGEKLCAIACHRWRTYAGTAPFSCRVIHSLPLMMSAIHVFYMDKMAAVAHLITTDQLPLHSDILEDLLKEPSPEPAEPEVVNHTTDDNAIPSTRTDKRVGSRDGAQRRNRKRNKKTVPEVSTVSDCATLNPKKGQRAVLIKSGNGDWGIVVGTWHGYCRGIPAKPGREATAGCPGYLKVHLLRLPSHTWHSISLEDSYKDKTFKFSLLGVKVDMKEGKVRLHPEQGDFPEHLALAFSVAILHVMCQPQPPTWKPGQSVTSPVEKRGSRPVSSLPTEEIVLINAAGALVETPSNHLIQQKIRSCSLKADRWVQRKATEEGNKGMGTGVVAAKYFARMVSAIDGFELDSESGGCGGCGGCGTGGEDILSNILGDDDEDDGSWIDLGQCLGPWKGGGGEWGKCVGDDNTDSNQYDDYINDISSSRRANNAC